MISLDEKITDFENISLDEELDKALSISKKPITEIYTISDEHFALGDRVYYIRPYNMCKIKSGTIKQFIWKCEDLLFPNYDKVLDNGDVVCDRSLFGSAKRISYLR